MPTQPSRRAADPLRVVVCLIGILLSVPLLLGQGVGVGGSTGLTVYNLDGSLVGTGPFRVDDGLFSVVPDTQRAGRLLLTAGPQLIAFANGEVDGTHMADPFNAGAGYHDYGGADVELPNGSSLPSTCTVGQVFWLTGQGTNRGLHMCRATDTWERQGQMLTAMGYLRGTARSATGVLSKLTSVTQYFGVLGRARANRCSTTTGRPCEAAADCPSGESCNVATVRTDVSMVPPTSVTCWVFTMTITPAPISGGTRVFTVMTNDTATALALSFSGSTATGTDTETAGVSIASTQQWSLRSQVTGSDVLVEANGSWLLRCTTSVT